VRIVCFFLINLGEAERGVCAEVPTTIPRGVYAHHATPGYTPWSRQEHYAPRCTPTMGEREAHCAEGVHQPWEGGGTLRRGVYTHHGKKEAHCAEGCTPTMRGGRPLCASLSLIIHQGGYTHLRYPLGRHIHHWLYLSGRLYTTGYTSQGDYTHHGVP